MVASAAAGCDGTPIWSLDGAASSLSYLRYVSVKVVQVRRGNLLTGQRRDHLRPHPPSLVAMTEQKSQG